MPRHNNQSIPSALHRSPEFINALLDAGNNREKTGERWQDIAARLNIQFGINGSTSAYSSRYGDLKRKVNGYQSGQLAIVEVEEYPDKMALIRQSVQVTNGQIVCDSRFIAQVFDKAHKNVLRDIEALLSDRLNFEPISAWFIRADYKDQ